MDTAGSLLLMGRTWFLTLTRTSKAFSTLMYVPSELLESNLILLQIDLDETHLTKSLADFVSIRGSMVASC